MLERYHELVDNVSALSQSNASLTAEAVALERRQGALEESVKASKSSLCLAIGQLPAVVDFLALEMSPVRRPRDHLYTRVVQWLNAHRQIKPRKWRWQWMMSQLCSSKFSTDVFQLLISSFNVVEARAREAQDEAGECKLQAADLASRAARQESECDSAAGSLRSEELRARSRLSNVLQRISSANEEMIRNEGYQEYMEAKAENHDERSERYGRVSNGFSLNISNLTHNVP